MSATYVIGDVHGCFDSLQGLWPRLGFNLRRDRLWLVGDLVNRGPRSLEVLRWAADLESRLGDRMTLVLGNHDLHLIGFHDGYRGRRPGDTLDTVLEAADGGELVAWLSRRPLVHRDGDVLLVHAGVVPGWTPERAAQLAGEIEPMLRDRGRRRQLLDRSSRLADDSPVRQLRSNLQVFTGLRTCTVEGEPCKSKGPPEEAPPGCLPWFRVPGRRSAGVTVVFGHWAAMGLRLEPSVIGLDTACVWGRRLTAIRLDDRQVFQQETLETDLPGR